MGVYFLTECQNCLEVIPMKDVNCRHCGSFQLHIDKELFDKKIQSFELLAQHRMATEERIEKLFNLGADHKLLCSERSDMNKRRRKLAQMVMDKIEEKEYFLLN